MLGSLVEAILLGFLQGVAGILPISYSGHVALARLLFRTEGDSGLGVALGALGVLTAIVWVLRQPLRALLVEGAGKSGEPRRFFATLRGQDVRVVLVAALPTAALGFALRPSVWGWNATPLGIGVGLALTTLALLSTQWVGRNDVEFPSWRSAVLLGVAQGFATLIGVSRSGVTIATALWLGVQRERAFELSLLISLPMLLGFISFELFGAALSLGGLALGLVRGAVAFGVGVAALHVLRKSVMTGWFPWFALWVGPLAIATLAMARVWPIR